MPASLRHPGPAALAGALLAVAAGALGSALAAFYLTALATAILLGAGFAAYLELVDRPGRRAAVELAATGLACGLLMADAAIRFPSVVSGVAPDGADALAAASFTLAAVACVAPLARRVRRLELRGQLLRQTKPNL
jgi:hypothetical protein